MEFSSILEKRQQYVAVKGLLPEITMKSFEEAFEVEYTHNSTAIEGNTLTLIETKIVLEDGIAVGGKPLREIYEVVNHKKAYRYLKELIKQEIPFGEDTVKDLHALLMENILQGGIYRMGEVSISGASHTPPSGDEMYHQIKQFFSEMQGKAGMGGIQLAAWSHAEFVRIHPFVDGNGRVARLIMNYHLLKDGFLPVSIAKEDRITYYNALDAYASGGNLDSFTRLIADLEEKQLDKYLAAAK